MGRGILYRGRWATEAEAPKRAPSPKLRLRVPFQLPSWVMSEQSVRLFNAAVYHQHLPQGSFDHLVQVGLVSGQAVDAMAFMFNGFRAYQRRSNRRRRRRRHSW